MDMVRVGNVTANVLATLAVVADFGFSFGSIIEAYNDQMHRRIRVDPFCVAKLRCLFLKLKSTMDLPLLRLAQCGGKDLLVVGEYYSQQLVNYVRAVLEVIPVSMFRTLDKIIAILTSGLKELPARLEKDKLKEYSQLGVRFRLAEATYEIAAFTQGILAMERTFVGVIEIDPRQILEDGIRKQLVQRIATIGHSELVFSHKQTSFFGKVTKTEVPFEERLASLAAHLEGLRRSLEYIQDYVNIYGLRVWQQEFQRIISFMVEQECNMFLKKQVPDWQSSFQSAAIPIPRFPPVDEHSVNFMGRLTRQLLQQTHPARTMYLYPLSGWFDGNGKEVVGIRMFSLLKESVGVLGLSGIDKLVCFMVVHRLQTTLAHYRARVLGECAAALSYFERHVTPLGGLLEGQEVYTRVLGSLAEGVWQPLLSAVVFIGHAQLLRRQIATEVASSCKMDSNLLSCTLETINESLLRDVRAHYLNPESSPFPGEESPLLPEISHYLTTTGIHNPISQIYVTTEPIDHLPALLFLFTLTQLPKYAYDSHFSVLAPRMERGKAGGKGGGTADACALIIGVLTVLRQFHSSHLQRYIQYLVQYIRAMLQPGAAVKDSSNKHSGQTTFSIEATTAICFLEDLARYGNIPREMLQMNVPPFIMDNRDTPE
jgi:WASH complex subunit strumpellin